jgi:hypothetical protein
MCDRSRFRSGRVVGDLRRLLMLGDESCRSGRRRFDFINRYGPVGSSPCPASVETEAQLDCSLCEAAPICRPYPDVVQKDQESK